MKAGENNKQHGITYFTKITPLHKEILNRRFLRIMKKSYFYNLAFEKCYRYEEKEKEIY
jgi:hypothetical protein